MLIYPSINLIYLCPPRTASRSIETMLREKNHYPVPGLNGYNRHGIADDSFDIKNYQKMMSCRHPFDRLISFFVSKDKNPNKEQWGYGTAWSDIDTLIDFLIANPTTPNLTEVAPNQFLANVILFNNKYINNLNTQYSYYESVNNIDHLIKFESLEEDLKSLSFFQNIEILNINDETSVDWREYWTQDREDRLREWCDKDYKILNYPYGV